MAAMTMMMLVGYGERKPEIVNQALKQLPVKKSFDGK